MSKLPEINHERAVRAFEKLGFWIARQGKHIAMTNGERIITIPRANELSVPSARTFKNQHISLYYDTLDR